MDELKIHGFAASTYVQTARLVCEEKHIAYTLQPLEFRSQSHRALHPFLRMPALTHGRLRLFETLAICTYLDHTFSGLRLVPEQLEQRCVMLQWISAATDYLYGALVRTLVKAEVPSDASLAAAGEVLGIIDVELARHEYFGGREIALSDLFIAPIIGFAMTKLNAGELLQRFPHVTQWHERMSGRPSFGKVRA